MKRLLVVAITACTLFCHAQTQTPPQKIGHADWQYILNKVPDYRRVENELRTYEAQLQNQLALKKQELETKYKAYEGLSANTPEAIRKDKESELNYLNNTLQKFQQDASASMQKKQGELIEPLLAKVGKAINDVAVEHGFSYIINPQMMSGGDVILYGDEKYNISNLVLAKLGVPIPNADKGNISK
jgi:outer membrane protein